MGGPGSFQERIQRQFLSLGWKITYLSESSQRPDVVFVVGGTRKVFRLFWLKVIGVPVLYRLDGILWIHRKRWPGIWGFAVNEVRNALMKFTHAFIADYVVYQSEFVSTWWSRSGWRAPPQATVVRNGVDLEFFRPAANLDNSLSPSKSHRVTCVEGNIDYSPYAIGVINIVAEELAKRDISIHLYGSFASQDALLELNNHVNYHGFVPRAELPKIYQAGVYLSLDVNAACPNTVIEAMSCGLPVVGFNTGALPELVPPECGRIVEFGGDPWQLSFPDTEALCEALAHVVDNYDEYSRNALEHAQREFGIQDVANSYANIIEGLVAHRSDAR